MKKEDMSFLGTGFSILTDIPEDIKKFLESGEDVLYRFKKIRKVENIICLESIFITNRRVIKMASVDMKLEPSIENYSYEDMRYIELRPIDENVTKSRCEYTINIDRKLVFLPLYTRIFVCHTIGKDLHGFRIFDRPIIANICEESKSPIKIGGSEFRRQSIGMATCAEGGYVIIRPYDINNDNIIKIFSGERIYNIRICIANVLVETKTEVNTKMEQYLGLQKIDDYICNTLKDDANIKKVNIEKKMDDIEQRVNNIEQKIVPRSRPIFKSIPRIGDVLTHIVTLITKNPILIVAIIILFLFIIVSIFYGKDAAISFLKSMT